METTQTPAQKTSPSANLPTTLPSSAISDKELVQIVGQAYFRRGQASSDANTLAVAADLKQQINANFRSLTPADIRKAIENGTFGKYGEVYSVSVAAMVDWLNAYTIDPDRIAAMHNTALAAKYALPQKATTTNAEFDRQMRQAVYDKYADYCAKGEFLDVHSLSYDFLNRLGIINPTAEEKRAIYDHHLKSENGRADIRKRKGIVPIGVALSDIAKSNAVARCKYYFLLKFFEAVKESGGEITDYV